MNDNTSGETAQDEKIIHWDYLDRVLVELVLHYQDSAPDVAAWLDAIYMRVADGEWELITMAHLRQVQSLIGDDGHPLHANYAQNQIYHWKSRHEKSVDLLTSY